MTSITTYTPFTYCLTFLPTGKRYYGVRYAKDCHPDQLWTTYFTSSEIISDLIEEHGKDAFTFEVRKTFITSEQARSWETKFLTRINAAKHPEWLNGHNGGKNFHSTPESVKKRKDTLEKNGTLHPMKNPETVQKVMRTKKKNGTGPDSPESIQKGKDTKTRNGTLNPSSPESIQKGLDTKKKNGTLNPSSPESLQKRKETMERNGTENCMKNPETVQRAKDTKIRNGTLPAMKNPETVQKVKNTKKDRGIENPSKIPFLSIIHNQKTYAKSHISRLFPDLKQYY